MAVLAIPLTMFLYPTKTKSLPDTKDSHYWLQKKISPGEQVFKKYCLTCHQADGGGVPNLNPPLIKTEYVLGDKARLIGIVIKGFNEKIEIDGDHFSNTMPELSILKDREIADVLSYVRSNFGNKASAVTVEEVKAVRGKK
jgi:mono/diheme cytochrome c family protein